MQPVDFESTLWGPFICSHPVCKDIVVDGVFSVKSGSVDAFLCSYTSFMVISDQHMTVTQDQFVCFLTRKTHMTDCEGDCNNKQVLRDVFTGIS